MADVSKVKTTNGTTYNIKDATARQQIADMQSSLTGAMHYIGITTTALSDGATTATISIDGASKTLTASDAGSVVIYGEKEFVWNGTKWQEFGSTGSLKALAFKDTASGSLTPSGSVSKPTFTGTGATITVKNNAAVSFTVSKASSGTATYTPEGSVSQPTFTGTQGIVEVGGTVTGDVQISAGQNTGPNYTPEGTVSAPTFTGTSKSIKGSFSGTAGSVSVSGTSAGSVSLSTGTGTGFTTITPAGSVSVGADNANGAVVKSVTPTTGTVKPISGVGTLPTLTTSVSDETLQFSFSQGTLPTAGADVTVVTGVSSTKGNLSFSGTAAGIKATFTGGATTLTGSFTPSGSVSLSSGTGTGSVDITPAGSVSAPTFTGEETQFSAALGTAGDGVHAELVGPFTPSGTVSQPTFTGTGARLTGSIAKDGITSTGSYTPAGSVSQPTFTGNEGTVTVS